MSYDDFATEIVTKLNILNFHLEYWKLYIVYDLFHCLLMWLTGFLLQSEKKQILEPLRKFTKENVWNNFEEYFNKQSTCQTRECCIISLVMT